MYNNRLLEFLGVKNRLLWKILDSGEVRTWSGPRSGPKLQNPRHFSIFATSLTLDLAGVEYIPGNLVYLYYFVADSDIHIECGSMDIFSADNPRSRRKG